MSKIIVPQELQNQIVNLYNNGMTRKDIRIQLNTPFGDSVIKRILVENKCIIRTNPGAKKGGRKKEIISEQEQQKIIELYKQGYGLNYISKQMGKLFCADKVRRVLKDNNIELRDFHEAIKVKPEDEVDLRKYKINDNYNFESHNGAYILGFLAADGYLPAGRGAKNRIALSLARKDEEILYRIKEELGYTGPIYQYTSQGFPASSLTFNSKKIRKAVENYGIVNNKTFKLKELPKNLPDKYMIDYIRGYFDGDGCILGGEKQRCSLSFTGASKDFLSDLSKYLHNKYGVKEAKLSPDHKNFNIRWGARQDILILGDNFYNYNYLALKRKQDHYFEISKILREQLPRDQASHKDEEICQPDVKYETSEAVDKKPQR